MASSHKKYIIGTRGSLLALTQCNQVKNQLEALTGDKFELKVITTQGDQQTEKPLWQLDGKDFFTKELDQALVNGEVDMVVHSYKDLGTERPEGIQLAAITKRNFAQDILLIKQTTIDSISSERPFVIGTSSPRRITNIESTFHEYLPINNVKVETKVLRGNVNTRIEKLQNNEYDAIVLAFAGLERLAMDGKAATTLREITKGLNFFVMPQSDFPSAAAQGALGIECAKTRTDDGELLKKLNQLQDSDTVDEVNLERKSFTSYGGGCHLAVGINVRKWKANNKQAMLEIHRGQLDGKTIDLTHMHIERPVRAGKNVFIGLPEEKVQNRIIDALYDRQLKKIPQSYQGTRKAGHFLVSSGYCLETLKDIYESGTIWASGTQTAKLLAKAGHWINGTTDALGEQGVIDLQNSHLIQLLLGKNAKLPSFTLSFKSAKSIFGEVIESYDKEWLKTEDSFHQELKEKDFFYWTSFDQFQRYVEEYPWLKEKLHGCGMGKTFHAFEENKYDVIPFANMRDLNQWLGQD